MTIPPGLLTTARPLVIAEVDEDRAALKRSTVTAIDDRQPWQPEIELSNFSLLENRTTHQLELFLAAYGQNPEGADCYRYLLTLVDRPEDHFRTRRRRVSPWLCGLDAAGVALVQAQAKPIELRYSSGAPPKGNPWVMQIERFAEEVMRPLARA